MRTVARPIGARVRVLWHGPRDLPSNLKLQWRFVAVRWLGIACLAPALLLLHLPPEWTPAAYALLAVASVYNGALHARRGTIRLSGEIVADEVCISVSDTGIG